LPEAFFDLPEVGRLPGEGGAMDLAECRKPLAVVPPEEEVDGFVGVYAEKLADDLDGEDLGVGELRSGAAPTDTPAFDSVVDEAEDGHDEGAKIHEKKTSAACGAIESTPSVGRSSLLLKSSTKLAHGVS